MNDDTKKLNAAARANELREAEDLPEVEKCVLACALLDEKAAALMARAGVKPEWFHATRCREICARVLDSLAQGRPVDYAAMAVDLQQGGKTWGPRFVEELAEKEVLPAHAEYYVSRLAEAFFRREVYDACSDAQSALDAAEEAPDATASRLSERLAALLRWRSAGTAPSPYQLRVESVEEFHHAHEEVQAGRPATSLGLSWGIPGLDWITQGLYPGLHIIAARPSFGKTMLENYIALTHLKAGRRVARACLDMTPRALALRALTLLSGETLSKMRNGFMTASDEAKVRAAAEASRLWHEHILTETTAEEIVARARAIKAADGLDLLTVDYIQLVGTTEQQKFMNDNMVISRAMKALKGFANDTGTPVLLLSQLSRAVEKEDRAPQLSDLRDSGSIEQDAKTVTFVYPEPAVMARWMQEQGVVDWKALDIRPGVLNVLKNQDGGTGAVAVRQFARYGIYEQCARLTREDAAAHRAAIAAAKDAAALKHRSVAADVPASVAMGYDFARAAAVPEALYSVCKHPKGSYEVFLTADLPLLNAAAARLGAEPWNDLLQVSGLMPALAALRRTRAEHGLPAADPSDAIFDPAGPVGPAIPPRPDPRNPATL